MTLKGSSPNAQLHSIKSQVNFYEMYDSQSILFIGSILEKGELLDDLYLICYAVGGKKIPHQFRLTIIASLVLECIYVRADTHRLARIPIQECFLMRKVRELVHLNQCGLSLCFFQNNHLRSMLIVLTKNTVIPSLRTL